VFINTQKRKNVTTTKYPKQEAILSLINRLPSPKLPESRRDKVTGAGEWSNLDLDEALVALGVNRVVDKWLKTLFHEPYSGLVVHQGCGQVAQNVVS